MRHAIALLMTAVCVALVAGCGGGSKSTTTAASTPASSPATTATAPATTDTTTSPSTVAGEGCATVKEPMPHTDRTHEAAPTERLSPAHRWTVILDTNCGLISIDLAVKQAPKTSSAFGGLVKRGFFDGLTFHRVANQPDGTPFVIQGGDPLGTGEGGPGFKTIEPPPSSIDYTTGVVAMAKESAEPSGTSGSQFFIVTGADAGLPAQYALLGHVSSGTATVNRIAKLGTPNETPSSPVVIRSATLTEH